MKTSRGGRGLDIDAGFEQQNGSPQYLGTIQSTGTNVIQTLSNLFGLSGNNKGVRLMMQADAPGYFSPANHATTPFAPNVVNSATTGVKLAADEKYFVTLAMDDSNAEQNGQFAVQWISVSGTTNLKLWRMR